MKPYPKHDHILHRDLTPQERLEPARAGVRFMRRMLDDLDHVLRNASDSLTEDQLKTVCDAVQNAYNAVSNAAYLGDSDYHAFPVKVIRWDHEGVEK